jgi:hypothetical protein
VSKQKIVAHNPHTILKEEKSMYLSRTPLNEGGDYAGTVSPDLYGAIDMIIESEREWHTLEMKMIKAEHTAIVTEDTALMEGAISDFYQKAKAWFVSMWKKIQEFISRLIERIGVFFMSAKKFVSKYGAALEKLTSNEMKGELEVFEGIAQGKDIAAAAPDLKGGTDLGREMDDDAIRAAYGLKTAEEVRDENLGAKSMEKLTPDLVKKALGILRGEAKLRQSIDLAKRGFEKATNEAIKACEAGKANLGDEEKAAANRKIANYKKAITLANASFSAYAAAVTTKSSNALSICKKAWNSRPKKNYGQNPYKDESAGFEGGVLDRF